MRKRATRRRALHRGAATAFVALLAIGVGAAPAWASAPDAPDAPSVSAGNAQIVVTFAAPDSDGGSMITAYNATCTSSNGGVTAGAGNGGAVSPITVIGLTNGKNYSCTVDATNGDGTSAESAPSSPAVVPSTVPDAPDAPAAAAGNGAISVTFSPPSGNGSHITGYTATCSGGFAATGAGSPIIVTGLTNGTSYTCTVDATNANGTSAESPPSNAATPVGPPDAPAAPGVAADHTEITVTFGAPDNNGGHAITSYAAECTAGTSSASMSGPGSPIVVTGLAKGATYTCTVAATNSLGTGPPSAASAPVSTPADVPNVPARPGVQRGNKKITVTFSAPANNGSPIISYTVRCTGGIFAAVVTGPSSPIHVTGLTNGTRYVCSVKATNALGSSHASNLSASVVPAAVPDAPARPTVQRGVGKIIVRFSKVANSGSPIVRYTATCTSVKGVLGTHNGAASPITVTGLTNGRSYTCYVTATNAVGTSPRSLVSASLIPGTAPAPPTLLSVVPNRANGPVGGLLVAFKAGSNNGTPISSYKATCTPNGGGVTHIVSSTGTPILVSGLVTGTAYTCRVIAMSASGTSGPSGAMTTIVGTPGLPKILSINAKSHGLVMTFQGPADNGNAILHYHATCKSTNGGVAASQFARGSPFPVNALTPGGRYTCRLTAVNSRGEGPAATAGPVRVPF